MTLRLLIGFARLLVILALLVLAKTSAADFAETGVFHARAIQPVIVLKVLGARARWMEKPDGIIGARLTSRSPEPA